jgi:hypothetical protein
MATPTQRAVEKMIWLLSNEAGLLESVARLRDPDSGPLELVPMPAVEALQAPAELREKKLRVEYPSLTVAVDRVKNEMREKFRRFSGIVRVVAEVRVSQDRLDGLTESLQFYADAVGDAIERQRGDLGDGVYLPGTYEVTFEAVKRGGLNYQQTARVSCELAVSRD